MKKRLILFGILVFLFAMYGGASATWYFTHGTSGHFEDEFNMLSTSTYTKIYRKHTGLEYVSPIFGTTWVHFPFTANGGASTGAQYINLKFNIEQASDTKISHVQVYNGDLFVKSFTVNWNTVGFQSKTLNLGSITNFNRGLVISVELTSGYDAATLGDRILFISAGANFVPIP
jgi:hypothetical protein